MLAAGNERPPLALRVNRRVTTRDALPRALRAGGRSPRRAVGDAGIVVLPPHPVTELPGFAEGAFSVQDLGAQLAAPLLRPAAGMRVLDACAAPGGKTTHLAELADVELVALDADRGAPRARAREPRALAAWRARASTCVAGDAGDPSRVVGRRARSTASSPTCRARRRASSVGIRTSSGCAAKPISQASRGSRRGFSTRCGRASRAAGACSTRRARSSREENEAQIAAFVARHADALRETLTFAPGVAARGGQLLPSLPGRGPQSGRILLRAARQGLTGARAADGACPPGQAASGSAPMSVSPASALTRHASRRFRSRPAARGCVAARVAALALAVDARDRWPRHARAPTRSSSSRPSSAPTRTGTTSTPSSTSRSTRRSTRRCRRACRSISCSSSSSCARAGTGSTRRCSRSTTQYRVSYNALTRQYRDRERPAGPDVRVARRGRALPVARRRRARSPARDQLVKGTRYEAARAAAARRQPAAEAVPGERARLARMDAAIGVVPLELHAVSAGT